MDFWEALITWSAEAKLWLGFGLTPALWGCLAIALFFRGVGLCLRDRVEARLEQKICDELGLTVPVVRRLR